MASVGAANPPAPPGPRLPSHGGGGGGIRMDDLRRIDIGQLSQSELQALSSCSVSSFDVRRTDDVVSPQLDRSVFNESAGSRRQTYSRLHHRSHSRLPGPHHSLKPHRHPHPSSSDPVSHSIVHFLKHFLSGNYNPPPPPPMPPSSEPPEAVAAPIEDLGFLGLQENLKIKRRRVRKGKTMSRKKLLENGVGVQLQGVNGKGELVDFDELERKGDELYDEELKRRTVGLEIEDDVLGFLSGLEGQWCSRRKKRKYVDAGLFGDALPIGWKILLGLRRRGYHVSVYCRRFISPTGQQFMSCKEAASFLKSCFGGNDARQQTDQKTCSIQQAYVLSSGKNANLADKTDDMAQNTESHSTLSINAHDINNCLMGIDNLPEVQVKDIFECFKCNLTFDEKNLYLQHLFSFHQKTTKRYKFGTPVGEGVIIRDGKFECQFCHKVFDERRSYNGHVGVHVRNAGKESNELVVSVNVQQNDESPFQDVVALRPSETEALVEIAQNSSLETSTVGTGEQAITDNSASDPVKIQADDHSAVAEELNHGHIIVTENNEKVGNDFAWNVDVKMDVSCINDSESAVLSEFENYENNSMDIGSGNRCLEPSDDRVEDTPGLGVGEIVFQDGVSSVPLIQSFELFPSFDSVSNKGEHEFSVVDQKLENVTGFEELRFDDMEPFKYDFMNEQEFPSLPGGSMNLGNDSGIEDGFNSSIGFGSDEVMLNGVDTNQLTERNFKKEGYLVPGKEAKPCINLLLLLLCNL
ncbi:methyl-cpg-binding domain-containing protein 8 [Phtheirospermum japonicum]|uniref:Methyl-cpg-binding domain-containing protein 8 n=1 Tax=Phtheirospermum japonicum TaxID=374723 RepID=A0A830CD89_9LAMI|nr:methyl-cpg-binding domain-containing protein 8 [Phtheirospermum japonicum]